MERKGFAEVVLTGINIGNYKCPQTGADLAELCRHIAQMEGNFRVRFSSIELQTVTDGVIEMMHRYPARFCNYFHLPLQAGCDKVLKDMNRHYDTSAYADKVKELRARVPQIGIFADVIAGYPTETEADFEATYAFIKQVKLAGLHVFSYSRTKKSSAAQRLCARWIKNCAPPLRPLWWVRHRKCLWKNIRTDARTALRLTFSQSCWKPQPLSTVWSAYKLPAPKARFALGGSNSLG